MNLKSDSIKGRVARLYHFAYSIAGEGNDAAIPKYLEELPFDVRSYDSGAEVNGWTVWPGRRIEVAEIRMDGDLIYDGKASPLGVIERSASFRGTIDRDELREHLHFSTDHDDAITWHCRQLYRPTEPDWGFCVPYPLYESLKPGYYDVDLSIRELPSSMKVLDFQLTGTEGRTIVLNAHNCHPYQANDDISGVAVGIEVMKRLGKCINRRFTYRLVIAPELTGTVHWLDEMAPSGIDMVGAILLKSVGNDAPLKLQESFTGASTLDRAAHHVMRQRYGTYESGSFRTIYGNDEIAFEAPGFEVPSITLTRYPFAEYHTDLDTPDRLSESALADTADAAFEICMAMEMDVTLQATRVGLPCLSHPRFDLYVPVWDPSVRTGPAKDADRAWNLLMNRLPRYLDGSSGLLEIADQHGLPIETVYDYAMRWVDKGLARVSKPKSSDTAT